MRTLPEPIPSVHAPSFLPSKHFPEIPQGAALIERYAGRYVGGLRNDFRGEQCLGDGSVYNGGFKSGVRNGHGTLRGADRRVFSGKWVGGFAEGRGSLVENSGFTTHGLWERGGLQLKIDGTASRIMADASLGGELSLRF